MATNTFLKPELIVDTAIQYLQREIVLAPLIWTNGLGDFAANRNDTINIRIPKPVDARQRTLRGTGEGRKIALDTLNEYSIPVKLDQDIYSAIPMTDEELTLDITDFTRQVLSRQVNSIVQKYEGNIASLIEDAPYQGSFAIDPTKIYNAFVDANTYLNQKNVPMNERTLVLGSEVAAEWLKSDQLKNAATAGDSNALRNGQLGRLGGLTPVIGSNFINPKKAYLFHRTAFVAAQRAPIVPTGAVAGATTSSNGLSIRWIRDYDADYGIDRSVLNTYAGFAHIEDGDGTAGDPKRFIRAVELALPGAGS